MKNLFDIPTSLLQEEELFESLATGEELLIERIISSGQITPEGEWYDQESDEWVVLLQGAADLLYEDGTTTKLSRGDYAFIPAHVKHRVTYTSNDPPCIWLAVHGTMHRC